MTNDKICLVTGATSGIGRATAAGMARAGFQVTMVARDKVRGEATRNEIRSQTENEGVDLLVADLSSLASVRNLVTAFQVGHSKLDVLVNDAATYSKSRALTPEGFELMFATNYLGPFLLTRLLIPELEAAKHSRVINVTAPSTTEPSIEDLEGEGKFRALNAFGASKAADLLFTYALAERVRDRGIAVNAYHPGLVRTELMHGAPAPVRLISGLGNLVAGISPERASEGLVQLATSEQFEITTGQLVHKGKVISAPLLDNRDLQERLWSASSKLVGLPEVM